MTKVSFLPAILAVVVAMVGEAQEEVVGVVALAILLPRLHQVLVLIQIRIPGPWLTKMRPTKSKVSKV